MKKSLVWVLGLLLFAGTLSTPALADEVSGNDALAGSEWGPLQPGDQFIRFEAEGRVVGSGGCNRIFGSYELSEVDRISIGPLASTKMMCPPEIMDNEADFIAAIESARSFVRETVN